MVLLARGLQSSKALLRRLCNNIRHACQVLNGGWKPLAFKLYSPDSSASRPMVLKGQTNFSPLGDIWQFLETNLILTTLVVVMVVVVEWVLLT